MELILTNGDCDNCALKYSCEFTTEQDVRDLGSNQHIDEIKKLILDCKLSEDKHFEVKSN